MPHQKIEGRPQIMNNIPDNKWPVFGNLYYPLDPIDHSPIGCFICSPKVN